MDKDLEKELRQTMMEAMDKQNTELLYEHTSEGLTLPPWSKLSDEVKTQFERINEILIKGIEVGYMTALIDQEKE